MEQTRAPARSRAAGDRPAPAARGRGVSTGGCSVELSSEDVELSSDDEVVEGEVVGDGAAVAAG